MLRQKLLQTGWRAPISSAASLHAFCRGGRSALLGKLDHARDAALSLLATSRRHSGWICSLTYHWDRANISKVFEKRFFGGAAAATAAERVSGRGGLACVLETAKDAAFSTEEAVSRACRTRNFALMAHIDAGKTTTGEALLLLGGAVASKGSVDEGTTTLDFLRQNGACEGSGGSQERERGITIQSAATQIRWRNFVLNLIDTPGHIDFSAEVELSTAAIDGAVLILDGAKGVESQSVALWRLLQRRHFTQPSVAQRAFPRIIFVNKMDREGADPEFCLRSVRRRFGAWALPLNFPIRSSSSSGGCGSNGGSSGSLLHLIDLTDLSCRSYEECLLGDTSLPKLRVTLPPSALLLPRDEREVLMPWEKVDGEAGFSWWRDATLREAILKRRDALLEDIALLDDTFEGVFNTCCQQSGGQRQEGEMTLEVWRALRRIVAANSAVPVIFGSAKRTYGIEFLLDGVTALLPSPLESKPPQRIQLSEAKTNEFQRLAEEAGFAGLEKKNFPRFPSRRTSAKSDVRPPPSPSLVLVDGLGRERNEFKSVGAAALVAEENAAKLSSKVLESPDADRKAAGIADSSVFSKDAPAAAAAFKVLPDGAGGRLVFCRVYEGQVQAPCVLFNSTRQKIEFVQRVLLPHAAAFVSGATGLTGEIIVLDGLRHTRAGDTLHAFGTQQTLALRPFQFSLLFRQSTEGAPFDAKKGRPSEAFDREHGCEDEDAKFVDSAEALCELLRRKHARQQQQVPVCFSSVDCAKSSEEQRLEEALQQLQLQDPSLLYSRREGESLVLWGRGQLQLELVKDRLHTDFGRPAALFLSERSETLQFCSALSEEVAKEHLALFALGIKTMETPIEIAYKEFLLEPLRGTSTYPATNPSSSSPSAKNASSFRLSVDLIPLPLIPAEERLACIVKGEADPLMETLACAVFEAVKKNTHTETEEETGAPMIRLLRAKLRGVHSSSSSDAENEGLLDQSFVFLALSAQTLHQVAALKTSNEKNASGEGLLETVEAAAFAALSAGPLASYPLDFLVVFIKEFQIQGELPSPGAVSAVTAQLLRRLLHGKTEAESEELHQAPSLALLEPIMHLEMWLPASCVGAVSADLAMRRSGQIVAASGVDEVQIEFKLNPEGTNEATAVGDERFMEVHATVSDKKKVVFSVPHLVDSELFLN